MRLLTGSLLAVVLVALLVAGGARLGTRCEIENGDSPSERVASPPQERAARGTVSVLPGDVPEVVVTAERPAGLMPEVVVRACWMPEVVVSAGAGRPRMAL